jgi:acetyltransferase-like isoleucine patch superfamily enzyme
MNLSPIVLFVYNRPEHTRQTLEALAANDLADQSALYIYSDGPKHGALAEDLEKIAAVREVIRSQPWCEEVGIIESKYNKGLADSIVSGVTEVVNRHGRVIVLEDDIVTRKGFLRFMNDALNLYADDACVMQVSGMIFGTPSSAKNPTAFLRILCCHGWGTWKRAWDHYEHDVDVLIARLKAKGISQKRFDIDGGAHFYRQLLKNQEGSVYTWAVRWYASWLTAGGYALFPSRSLLTNIGHDGSGVHPIAPFYNGEMVDYLEVTRIPVQEDVSLRREVDRIWREGRAAKPQKPISLSSLARSALRPLLFPVKAGGRRLLRFLYPELNLLDARRPECAVTSNSLKNTIVAPTAKLYPPYHVRDSSVGDYSYLARNAWVSQASIGKFCSIGPNFCCGWGLHPTDGISTSPMFYSALKQNGSSLSRTNKVQERKPVTIGNDVFIGMNVTILDGVRVGDGAVIGAGCVVSKDVPPYAIVVGNPMQILRYRFPEELIEKLREIAWWDWPAGKLQEVEKYFFDVEEFCQRFACAPPGPAVEKPALNQAKPDLKPE